MLFGSINMEELSLDNLYLEYKTSFMPPKQRRRVELKLNDAGKLKRSNSTLIDRIIEKFEQEAYILGKTVITDNGSEKSVYSTCVFENTKRYNCNVCIMSVFGKSSLIRHNCSKKHYEMMSSKTHPHENFDDGKVMNIEVGMRAVSMSDCYIVKDLFEECQRRHINHVLIGLEYLIEVLDPSEPYYLCILCDKESEEIDAIIDHLEGYEHRMTYLMLFFPKVYTKLVLLMKDRWKVQLHIVVEKIQKKLGRLKPWRHDGALSLKQKKAIRYSIDSGPHLRDNADLSFAEDIVYNEHVRNKEMGSTVFTEFIINENENNEVYERLKGGIYRCKMCKISVNSLVEKLTHPYTGNHLEKFVKGMEVYESIACTIQSSFDSFPQPLIGTEYIVEYDEQGAFLYHCMLCRKAMNNYDMVLSHLVSKAHRQRYIKHHMPKKDEELLKLSGPVRAEEIEKLLKLIEAKHGRLPPFGSIYSLDHRIDSQRTVKDVISEKIMDGYHLTIDESGMPKIIKKMPIPLYPREGEIIPEAGLKSKKKKKKVRSSQSPRSRSSSRSLSPVARMRCLSPEAGPSGLNSHMYLPEEEVSPPALVKGWLNMNEDAAVDLIDQAFIRISRSKSLTMESMEEFFRQCDEKNWANVEPNEDCCPYLTPVECPLRDELKNDEAFYEIRRCLTIPWICTLVNEYNWEIGPLESVMTDPRLYRLMKIMETGRIIPNLCRPLCRNCVSAMVNCVKRDFPETLEIPDEELMGISLGLINMSNWLCYLGRCIQN